MKTKIYTATELAEVLKSNASAADKREAIRFYATGFNCTSFESFFEALRGCNSEYAFGGKFTKEEDLFKAALEHAENEINKNLVEGDTYAIRNQLNRRTRHNDSDVTSKTLAEIESQLNPTKATRLEGDEYVWVMVGTSKHRAIAFYEDRKGCVLPQISGTYKDSGTGLQVNLAEEYGRGRAVYDRLHYYAKAQACRADSKPAILCCKVKKNDIWKNDTNPGEYFIPRNADICDMKLLISPLEVEVDNLMSQLLKEA